MRRQFADAIISVMETCRLHLVVMRRPITDPHAPHIERRLRAFERDWLARQEAETTAATPKVD
jgi:hypothetical protein